MEIIITNKTASEFIIQTNKVRWKVYRQRVIFALLLICICGIIFFIAGLSQGYGISESNYKYNKNFTTSYVHTVQYNYHIILGLGIAFILFAIYLALIYLIIQRKKFFKATNKIVYRHKTASDVYALKLNDDGIYYKDFEMVQEEKWSVFTKYKIYKSYLLLFRDDFFVNALVIDKRQVSDSDFNGQLIFIKKKLIEKTFLK